MKDRALIAAINWNGRDFITGMIDSLLPQMKETKTRLLVFDNCSEDGSDDLVEEKYSHTGMVDVYRNRENILFGRAANRIIENARFSTVVLINTDTILQQGCLRNLLLSLESRSEVALVGPRLLWPDGTLQSSQRDFPFPGKLLLEHIPILQKLTAKFSAHDKGRYGDWLVGAMMAIRVKAFNEIGGFDEEFLFFHEETDLQYRLMKAGWKVWFEPSAEVFHLEGASSHQKYGRRIHLRHIPGKLLFLRKYGTRIDIISFKLLMTLLQVQRMMKGRLSGKLAASDVRCTASYCREAIRLLWRKQEVTS